VTRGALVGLLLALSAQAGNAVGVNGAVLRGDLRLDGEEVVLARKTKEERHAKSEFLLVEADDGKLLYAPHLEARLRAYEYLAKADHADACVKLLDLALAARDGKLSRRLLEMAQADGFSGKSADELKKKVEALESRSATVDTKKAEQVAARMVEIQTFTASLLLSRARVDETDGLRLLREALRLVPSHPDALALRAERAPKDFAWGPPGFWLDWHLDLERKGARLLPEGDQQLAQMRAGWRKDLYGVEAGEIRVVTPVTDTVTVSRCVAWGRLTCAALAEMFKTETPRLRMSKTLLVLLFPSKEEYVKKSAGESEEARDHLETTAGHYSPMEQLSRLVWDTRPDAERRIARVFVHELTHHWVTEFNPRYSNAELRISATTPGYWIVEGLATFLEEASFDIETGTWFFFDARAASLDTVQALAKEGRLLPWDAFYSLDKAKAQALPADQPSIFFVARRWHLGRDATTPARLFYEQAASTVHFLYHGEGGAYRARLIDYVTSYYTGKKDRLAIEAAFGLTPAQLGKKVEEYARSVANGWRP